MQIVSALRQDGHYTKANPKFNLIHISDIKNALRLSALCDEPV